MTDSSNNSDRFRDEWDVITGTLDGGMIWRRYSDGRIVVTHGDEKPQDVVNEREAVSAGGKANEPAEPEGSNK